LKSESGTKQFGHLKSVGGKQKPSVDPCCAQEESGAIISALTANTKVKSEEKLRRAGF